MADSFMVRSANGGWGLGTRGLGDAQAELAAVDVIGSPDNWLHKHCTRLLVRRRSRSSVPSPDPPIRRPDLAPGQIVADLVQQVVGGGVESRGSTLQDAADLVQSSR